MDNGIDSPVGFYSAVAAGGVGGRWVGVGLGELLASFEKAYGSYLCRVSDSQRGLEQSSGYGGGVRGWSNHSRLVLVGGGTEVVTGVDGVGIDGELKLPPVKAGSSLPVSDLDSKADGEVGKTSSLLSNSKEAGKWKRKNAAKRERKRKQKKFDSSGKCDEFVVRADARLKFPATDSGYFSGCEDSVKAELRSSRAQMLIAQNRQRARKALADVDRMNMEKDTRINEAKFELNRLTVDDKLRKISEARMGGSAQTVISSSITSSPPSLSSGSVSPSSSISVAEEMRLRNAVSSLTLEVEQLKKKQVNEVHDGTFVRREVRGTGVYRVHTEEDEFGYSQWD